MTPKQIYERIRVNYRDALFLLASIAMQNVAVCGIRTGYDLAT